jgi:hypothetical protein
VCHVAFDGQNKVSALEERNAAQAFDVAPDEIRNFFCVSTLQRKKKDVSGIVLANTTQRKKSVFEGEKKLTR